MSGTRKVPSVRIGQLLTARHSMDPKKHPDEVFDLLSIPAFDEGAPVTVVGSQIGSTKLQVSPLDVLVSKIVPHIQRVWVVPSTGGRRQIASSEWLVLRSHLAWPGYLQYALLDSRFHAQFMATVDGLSGSLQRARPQAVKQIEILLPSIAEQRVIADYLDRETAQIDAFIAKNEELIALLTERRAASIDNAFERVDAPLTRLKYRASIQTGVTLGGDGSPSDPEWPYLRVANVQVGRVELSEVKSVRVPELRARQSLLHAGDVLMTEGGDRDKLGRGALWTGEITPMLHQNHVFAVKVGRNLDARFLMRWLDTSPSRHYFESTAVQTTNLASTNKTLVGNLPLPFCSIQTQLQLVSDLDLRLEKIDGVIGVTKQSVNLARERKSALISAAVMGKIDVGVEA